MATVQNTSSLLSTSGRESAATAVRQRTARIDALAIGIALTLAVLIRLNLLPHIGW